MFKKPPHRYDAGGFLKGIYSSHEDRVNSPSENLHYD